MSISRSPIGQASALNVGSYPNCAICTENMSGAEECIILYQCSHSFHRTCIENYLPQSAECPTCKRPCELSELRTVSTQNLANPPQIETDKTTETATQTNAKQLKPSVRGKGRGAFSRSNQTRSASRNLFHVPNQLSDVQNIYNIALQVDELAPEINSEVQNPLINISNTPVRAVNTGIDYTVINQMIENSVTRILGNLNINPVISRDTNVNGNRPEIPTQSPHNLNRNINGNNFESAQPFAQPSNRPPYVYTSNIQLGAGNRTPLSHDNITLRPINLPQ